MHFKASCSAPLPEIERRIKSIEIDVRGMSHGDIFRLARQLQKMTQSQVGDAIGASQNTIHRAEKGYISSKLLLKLSIFFELSLDELAEECKDSTRKP